MSGTLPSLARLLNLRVEAQLASNITSDFFGRNASSRPFLIGVAAASQQVRALLPGFASNARDMAPAPEVDLITTDGFLQPNAELEEGFARSRVP